MTSECGAMLLLAVCGALDFARAVALLVGLAVRMCAVGDQSRQV
jgi:hypothetical protein